MDISKFCKTYKSDIICISLILLIFCVCSYLLWGYFGSLLYDCGREAYLTQLMLEGKILFKDIFGMYNPLSYQINALLYMIFGINTNVLYFAGTVNAFLTLICLYFISRQFMNEKYSMGIVFFIMTTIIFNSHDCTNNVFPYAFAMAYATTAMLYSAFLGLLYLTKQKSVYIILSFLLLGISLACKPEYVLCVITLISLMIYYKEKPKVWIFSILLFLLPTILSYVILFLQGFTTYDFIKYIDFINNFFATKEQQNYNLFLLGNDSYLDMFFYFGSFSIFVVVIPAFLSKFIKQN